MNQQRRGQQYGMGGNYGNYNQGGRYQQQYGMNQQRRGQQYGMGNGGYGGNYGGGMGGGYGGMGGGSVRESALSRLGAGRWSQSRGQQYGY